MKVFEGVVTSARLPKTVTVKVEQYFVHPVYKKRIKTTQKFLCHDEMGAKEGEMVTIQECRPMSAQKRFKVTHKSGVMTKVVAVEETAPAKEVKAEKTEKKAQAAKPANAVKTKKVEGK